MGLWSGSRSMKNNLMLGNWNFFSGKKNKSPGHSISGHSVSTELTHEEAV